MRKLTFTAIAASLLAFSLIPDPARAQPTRVFVAAQGSDGNPCTFALPCRSFQKAHDTVADNGEIDVLDPAGYGQLVITKAISIQGHGFAGMSVPPVASGIHVAANAADAVNLNGLLIEGNGVGGTGIIFASGKSLTVENSIARNLFGTGIQFQPSGSSGLAVSNTLTADNALAGIVVDLRGSGTVTAAFSRVEAYNNSNGIHISGLVGTTGGSITATVTDSVAAGNTFGFDVETGSVPAALTVAHSVSTGNRHGISAGGAAAILRIAGSTVTDNPVAGWEAVSGGTIKSFGDNNFDGNGSNSGTLSLVVKQ